MTTTTATGAAAERDEARRLYAQAVRDYHAGALRACRDGVEATLCLLAKPQQAPRQQQQQQPQSSSSSSLHITDAAVDVASHVLFVDALLLLSCVCAATHAYGDAERLLVTCDGYAAEHLHTSQQQQQQQQQQLDKATTTATMTTRIHATVAYNRAVLRLEQHAARVQARLRCTHTPAHNDDDGDGHRRHNGNSDSSDSSVRASTTAATLPYAASAAQLRDVYVARDVLLARAATLLQNECGLQRLLLADVWHTRGVCNVYVGDVVAALADYQRSLATRLRYGDVAGVTTLKLALTLEHVAHVEHLLSASPHHHHRVDDNTNSSSSSSGGDAAAMRLLALVAQTRRRYLGCTHPLYASTLLAQGVLLCERGHTQAAYTALQRAAHACAQQRDDKKNSTDNNNNVDGDEDDGVAAGAVLSHDVHAWLAHTRSRLLQHRARSDAA